MEASGMLRARLQASLLMLISSLVLPGSAVAQDSAEISINNTVVKAGETVQFIVTLDRPNDVADSYIRYTLALAGGGIINSGSGEMPRGLRKVTIIYKVPFDAEGGRYELRDLVFVSAAGKTVPLHAKSVPFDVIPNKDITYPTSAEVAINPSQVQLFRTAALSLAKRLQELRGNARTLQAKGPEAVSAELRKALHRELDAVKQTSERFRALGGNAVLQESARIFFSDLSLSYLNIDARLSPERLGQAQGLRNFSNAFAQAPKSNSSGYLAQEAVYRAAEQNELAYNIVANTGNLSFDLTVISAPTGATIRYGRRGDTLKEHTDPTKATIQSLPLAIWIIHFHKEGFQDQEREFNPFTEHEKLVDVTLEPMRR
jgi:hypothetical protein